MKLGIVRAEGVVFCISPRNSALGVAHLLERTGSKHVVVTPDLKPLADEAISALKERGSGVPVVGLMPAFQDLFRDHGSDGFEYLPEPKLKGLDDPVVILHSSGASSYFGPQSVSMMLIVSPRLCRVPKTDYLHEPQLGLLLAFAMARRP